MSGDWSSDTVSLANYAGQSNLILRFEAVSGEGLSLYVDNINIGQGGPLSVNETNTDDLFSVYPNPVSSTELFIQMNDNKNIPSRLSIYDVRGSIVIDKMLAGQITPWKTDVSDLANGLYTLKLQIGDEIFSKKINILR